MISSFRTTLTDGCPITCRMWRDDERDAWRLDGEVWIDVHVYDTIGSRFVIRAFNVFESLDAGVRAGIEECFNDQQRI